MTQRVTEPKAVLRLLADCCGRHATMGGARETADNVASTSALYKPACKWCIGDNRAHTASYRTVPGEKTQRTAAPEGGARTRIWEWVRGCVVITAFATTTVAAQDVPSGQSVMLDEVLVDQVGAEAWLRFRFLAPDIGTRGVTYTEAEDDFAVLCDAVARPYLVAFDLAADVVVISLMDRPVPFGQSDPDATQFFETFRIEDDTCVWQEF